jgi:hypothetical protein
MLKRDGTRCAAVKRRGGGRLPQAGWLSDVNFWIKDGIGTPDNVTGTVAGVPVAAETPGQGFSLTRDEAEELIRQATDVLTEINKMLLKAETLMQVTPPAQDPASINFNRQLVGNGQDAGAFGYGKGHLLREQGYLTELVQRLNEALGHTTSSDQSATVSLNRATDHGIA